MCVYDEKPLTEVQQLEARVSELENLLQAAMIQQQSSNEESDVVPELRPPTSAVSGFDTPAPSTFDPQPREFPRPDLALFTLGPENTATNIVIPPGVETSLYVNIPHHNTEFL